MKSKFDLSLRPIHYACVSGGKDSLYMLGYILSHLDKYPLDFVVHYELEIDWDWVFDVINFMELKCKKAGIPFYRIKPRTSFFEFYEKYGLPTRLFKWCNYKYKLDCEKQIVEWISSLNCRPVAYFGLCSNEEQRFKYLVGDNWQLGDVCYPLAEENISESFVLEWAKKQSIFNGWYKYFKRQGCMFCPFVSRKEFAYMYKYYPDKYNLFMQMIRESEERMRKNEKEKNKKYKEIRVLFDTSDNIDKLIKGKWLSILEYEEQQISIFDFFS